MAPFAILEDLAVVEGIFLRDVTVFLDAFFKCDPHHGIAVYPSPREFLSGLFSVTVLDMHSIPETEV